MSTANYPPPVDKLLTFGECSPSPEWPDYLALGLGPEHVPDLIRMATDEELNQAASDSLEVWAPVHAWRALGQLRAEAAIEPLLSLFRRIDENEDDWVDGQLPDVYGMIGPAAIPALTAYLADTSHGLYARISAASSLKHIGEMHPDARAECVAIFARQLEGFAEQDPTLNAFLVAPLLDLKAVEAAPVIERAFAADRVDESVVGDWEDVQIALGLKEQRETPPSHGWIPPLFSRSLGEPGDLPTHKRSSKTKAKAKRKQEKKSRRKNRKR